MKTAETAKTDISQLHRIEYEASPDIVVSAPGMVRLMGEHTSDSDGMYLAFPFDRRVAVAVSARRDSSMRFYAADLNERKRTNVANLKYKREDRWANFMKGALSVFCSNGGSSKGFNVTIAGDVPQGLGLGSSAALLCASVRAAALLADADAGDESVERAALAINRGYFEKPSRIAEYAAVVRAREGSVALVDAKKGSVELLPEPFAGMKLVLTDSRVPRPPVDDELSERAADCARGLAMLGGKGGKTLRSFTVGDLDELMGVMPEHVRRHCTFFIEEVQRVKEARDAIKSTDLQSLARLLNKSQAGLRNHFEVSCPEVDWLVKRALEIPGVHASRMTGKGFGGCTLTMLDQSALEEYRKRLEEYERIFGFKPVAWEINQGTGMSSD